MTDRIPPLSFNSGSYTDIVMDRVALHLRAKLPDVFGSKTLDEITLMFGALRDEVERVIEHEIGREVEVRSALEALEEDY